MLHYLIPVAAAILVGYILGVRFKNDFLISVLINHFLGCNPSNPCPCCQSTQVMFLPDETQPCKSFYNALMNTQPRGCTFEDEQKLYKNRYRPRIPCKYNHGRPNEPSSALIEIYKTLDSAKDSIRLCMYLIKLKEMVKFLMYLKVTKKIKIQIITNSKWEPKNCPKREMKLLQDVGIEVRTNEEGMMHNKFVVIDSKTLISGSINWTYTAFKNNDETVMITKQPGVVAKFSIKFDQMWETMELYRPQISIRQLATINFIGLAKADSGADTDDQSERLDVVRVTRLRTDSSREDILGSSEADIESSEEGVTISRRFSTSSNSF